jgi:hypothetical protein
LPQYALWARYRKVSDNGVLEPFNYFHDFTGTPGTQGPFSLG